MKALIARLILIKERNRYSALRSESLERILQFRLTNQSLLILLPLALMRGGSSHLGMPRYIINMPEISAIQA